MLAALIASATLLACTTPVTLAPPSAPASGLFPGGVSGAPTTYALDTAAELRLSNVTAEPSTLAGLASLRVQMTPEAVDSFKARTSAAQGPFAEYLAVLEGASFTNGVIEVELAGSADTETFPEARGFVGVAFRVSSDLRTYDAFYIRPTNGRADDQLRRNHAVQYISHPEWTWSRLRQETPGKYESYADLEPGTWTRVRIEVLGERARLFVNGASQPTLIVNDLKTGPNGAGRIALWIDLGTDAHFRNLRVTPH